MRLNILLGVVFVLVLFPFTYLTAQYTPFYFNHLTTADGLQDNIVFDAEMDKDGFMWFATKKGLSRFDGSYFKDIQYSNSEDSLGIKGTEVLDIMKDKDGVLWMASLGGGLIQYDPINEKFIYHSITEKDEVSFIMEDSEGELWGGTFHEGFFHFDKKTKVSTHYNFNPDVIKTFQKNSVWEIVEDLGDPNILWIAAANSGLFKFEKDSKKMHHFPFYEHGVLNDYLAAMSVMTDRPGEIWVGTWGSGLVRFDTKTNTFEYFNHLPKNKKNGPTVIRDIVRKSENELWIAAEEQGLVLFDESQKTFIPISPTNDPNSILSSVAMKVYIDPTGLTWVLNNGSTGGDGISILNPDKELFHFTPLAASSCEKSIDEAYDILTDHQKQLVFVTTKGCNMLHIFDGNFKSLKTIPLPVNNPIFNTKEQKYKLLRRDNGEIIIYGSGKYSDGNSILILDPKTLEIRAFDYAKYQANNLKSHWILSMVEDTEGGLWVLTETNGLWNLKSNANPNQFNQFDFSFHHIYNTEMLISKDQQTLLIGAHHEGLVKFDFERKQFKQFPISFNGNFYNLVSLAQSQNGDIWGGTSHQGIFVLKKGSEKWMKPPIQQNMNTKDIHVDKLRLDNNNNLWISSSLGLYAYNIEEALIQFYDADDGILDPSFSLSAFHHDVEGGTFFLGQKFGFYSFSENINLNDSLENIVFSKIEVLGDEPFEFKSVNYLDEIHLNHLQNSISISFSALDFTNNKNNQYAYQLKPLTSDWVFLDKKNNITLPNLSPDNYTLQIKNVSSKYLGNDKIKSLQINISSPWWASWWAYLLYSLLGIIIISAFYQWQLERNLAKAESKRMKELNELQTQLYTNITHEFRTPLTIISGTAENLNNQTNAKQLIKYNSNILLQLTNQLLDLSRLDAKRMPLHLEQVEIIAFLKYLVASFQAFAKQQEKSIAFSSSVPDLMMDIDLEKTQQIISNLLSNALKFTEAKDHILVKVSTLDQLFHISIQDSGIGIHEKDLPHIFDRFHNIFTPNGRSSKSTGIGLALVKELVVLHNGNIEVSSKIGTGTSFDLKLPISRKAPIKNVWKTGISLDHIPIQQSSPNTISGVHQGPGESAYKADQSNILLVEDNTDISNYLKSILSSQYHLTFANNGKLGLEQAKEQIPDIIISDIMMPEMDGYQLCEALKQDERTSHIPIILLTAKTMQEDIIAAWQKGADAYLTKPFNEKELLALIQKTLANRQRLSQYYLQHQNLPQEQIIENEFLQKIHLIIEEKMKDENFGIKDICDEVHLSRTQLYRKVKALTNLSPTELIRNKRIHEAQHLIKTTGLTIAEIAYKTGFKDNSYFTKVFREVTKTRPSDWRS